jgi:hypothetical protein
VAEVKVLDVSGSVLLDEAADLLAVEVREV